MSKTVLVISHPYAINMGRYTEDVIREAVELNIEVLRRLGGGKDEIQFATNNPVKELLFRKRIERIPSKPITGYEGRIWKPEEIKRLYDEYC